ncbi:hypothetical protein JDV02_005714 [Purpureocillium takamizusanense]|uniref:Uncharacterized protein n=1 Tax=Purpureocillium takamizusanense TaxID=2060973 RepID=A0A9Q8VC51_9HYPO|nr:uncharacterized protein JDV02_005714 [Purpureocillium takamizusanense]UNI19534.1 hypothetical protein JDV02_005714 [Purpureocillium takamizusanense]
MKPKYLVFLLSGLLASAAEDPGRGPGAANGANGGTFTPEDSGPGGELTGFEEATPKKGPGLPPGHEAPESDGANFWNPSNWRGAEKIDAKAASEIPTPKNEGSAKGFLYSPRPANQELGDVFDNGLKRTQLAVEAKPVGIKETHFVQLTGSAQVAYKGSIRPGTPAYFLKISPQNLEDGYYLPSSHPEFTEAKKYTFLTPGNVPRESIVGAWKVRARDLEAPQLEWVPNPHYSCLDKIKDFCTKPREQWRVKTRSSCFPRMFKRGVGAGFEPCLEPLEETASEGAAAEGAAEVAVESFVKDVSQPALQKEELEKIADDFAESLFQRWVAKYGFKNMKSLDGVPVKDLYPKFRAQMKGYKTLYMKPSKASPGMGIVAVVGVGFWVKDVVDAFKRDLPWEEKAAVATSIVPIVGCATRFAADGAADGSSFDVAKIADTQACVAADTLLLSPAWPLGLAIHGVRNLVKTIPAALKMQAEWDKLRSAEGLKQRYKEEWSSIRNQILNSTTIHLTELQVDRNITISRLSDLMVAAEAGGILKAGQVSNTTDQAARQRLLEDEEFPGRQELEKVICDKFTNRTSTVRIDLDQSRQAINHRIATERRKFMRNFIGHYTTFLVDNIPRGAYNIPPREKYVQKLRNHVKDVATEMDKTVREGEVGLEDIDKVMRIPPIPPTCME